MGLFIVMNELRWFLVIDKAVNSIGETPDIILILEFEVIDENAIIKKYKADNNPAMAHASDIFVYMMSW